MKPLGFGLLGCGRVCPKHAAALAENRVPGGRLVAVADCIPERAAKIGRQYSVPHFTSLQDMIGALGDEIDVVNILTPSGLHATHAVEVAAYGKHIVVEKPMALTLSDADRMIHAADAAGVRLFVVKQNRFNPPVKRLRAALEDGRFGKLVLGTVRVRWCRRQSYYDQDAWRGTWALDGGVFANQASHHVDLLQWMMGDVHSVFAKSRTALVDIETEDTGVVVLKFKSGALGIIEATTATRPKDLEGSISILGANGSVEVGGFAVNEMKVWNFEDSRPDDRDILTSASHFPPDVYGVGHIEYLGQVVVSIDNGRDALVDGLEGRKSLELISAIYESIETGQEVFLRKTPRVSVVIPCRNEVKTIRACVEAVFASDERNLEVIVVDGMSTDGTRDVLAKLAAKYPNLRILDNRQRLTPYAFNLGIRDAKGEFVQIVGSRNVVRPDYISKLVQALSSDSTLGCVGGDYQHVYQTEAGKHICRAMESRFGVGVGNFRAQTHDVDVDTVGVPMFLRAVFERVGLFDETLTRNQDDEFSFRLRRAGYRVRYIHQAKVTYLVREQFGKAFRQYFQYGYFKVLVSRKYGRLTTARQIVPAIFVAFLALAPVAAIFSEWAAVATGAVLLLYLALGLGVAAERGWSLPERLQFLRALLTLHLGYGSGYWTGIYDFLLFRRPARSAMKGQTT